MIIHICIICYNQAAMIIVIQSITEFTNVFFFFSFKQGKDKEAPWLCGSFFGFTFDDHAQSEVVMIKPVDQLLFREEI